MKEKSGTLKGRLIYVPQKPLIDIILFLIYTQAMELLPVREKLLHQYTEQYFSNVTRQLLYDINPLHESHTRVHVCLQCHNIKFFSKAFSLLNSYQNLIVDVSKLQETQKLHVYLTSPRAIWIFNVFYNSLSKMKAPESECMLAIVLSN